MLIVLGRSSYDALDTPMLMSLFLSVVSRLLLIGEPVFQLGLIEASVATDSPSTPATVLDRLIEVMCTKVLLIAQAERKKLICLALLKLMAIGDEVGKFLSPLAPIINSIIYRRSSIDFVEFSWRWATV
jgi:hypothetical protein